MSAVANLARRVLRSISPKPTALERALRRSARKVRLEYRRTSSGPSHVVFWNGRRDERRLGIYLLGSCDLPSIFKAVPLIRRELNGTCAVLKHGNIAQGRSDLLLQTLDALPEGPLAEAREKLHLWKRYFEPMLFERTFQVPDDDFRGVVFEKEVVVLSVAADATRTVYRHKRHGFLVDPGGWWLDRSKQQMLDNLETVQWFRENFESIGRVTAEQFFENYSRLIRALQERTEAQILIFNVLTVEPGNPTHTYQLIKNAHTRHRREINLALFELARDCDVSVIDIDRVLKDVGIQETQVDFAHYPPACYEPIANEIFRVLKEREVV